jgi:uncharacterized protein YjiS (DUF1127 family)
LRLILHPRSVQRSGGNNGLSQRLKDRAMLIHFDGDSDLKGRRWWNGFLDPLQLWLTTRWRDLIETRRAARRLSAADDHMLKDIGISRGDINYMVRHGRPRARSAR